MLIRTESYIVGEANVEADELGLPYEPVPNPVVIVAAHVVTYRPAVGDEGGTLVETTAGELHVVMPFDEFDRVFSRWQQRFTAGIN